MRNARVRVWKCERIIWESEWDFRGNQIVLLAEKYNIPYYKQFGQIPCYLEIFVSIFTLIVWKKEIHGK